MLILMGPVVPHLLGHMLHMLLVVSDPQLLAVVAAHLLLAVPDQVVRPTGSLEPLMGTALGVRCISG